MQKKQNLKRNIAGSIHKFYEAGIFVTVGFIVGFDNEKYGVADGIVQMIEDSAIPVAMAGLLYALPNTQLTRRLEKEGRLNPAHDVVNSGGLQGDQCMAGLNFDTLRPRRDALFDYCKVVEQAYAPAAYFSFVDVGQFMQQVGQNAPSVPHKSHQDQDPHHSTTALYQTLY